MTEKELNIINKLGNYIQTKNISNDFLVQLIELGFDFLNAETISDYARTYNMSYNGVKKCRNIVTIRNLKFVVENN